MLGIIKKASVKSGILLNNLSTNENQVRIIPAVSFACNGTITKALFAAVTEEETSASTTHPELQLWQTFSSLPWFYNRRSRASLEGAMATDELNVYEKSFPQPMRFETGDVLGLYLPQEEFSPLKLYFLVSGIHAASVPSYSIERGNLFTSFNANSPSAERDHDIPLLNIEIG